MSADSNLISSNSPCRTSRTDDEFRLAVRADFCQRDRDSDHDHRRLLYLSWSKKQDKPLPKPAAAAKAG
jgi:hypothetical protein